jgi:hypothetical protein
MNFTEEEKHGLGIALNEATLLGVEVDTTRNIAAATFSVLTLPKEGSPPDDPRRQILFSPVGRVAASLRLGRWDDPTANVVPFQIEELLSIVQSFGGLPIYGWEFFDVHDQNFIRWSDRLSLDYRSGVDGFEHSIELFQEGNGKHLDFRLWFNELQIKDPEGNAVSLSDFTDGGRRWWDALYKGDKRASGSGIFPLKSDWNAI